MGLLHRIRRLGRRDAVLLAQALPVVWRVRWYLLAGRHHDLRRMIDSCTVTGRTAPRADLAEVAWSVRAAARLVPGATCLTQASAGQLLLARRGYGTTVRLSVPLATRGGTLAPHAWLLSDEMIVLGGTPQEYARHRPLHDFDLPAEGARP